MVARPRRRLASGPERRRPGVSGEGESEGFALAEADHTIPADG